MSAGALMQIIDVPRHWPPLPMTEIVVLGDDTAEKSLVQPLLEFLIEGMRLPVTFSSTPAVS
jgi:hypothetical protein